MIDKRMRLQSGGPPGGGDQGMTYDAGAANRENRRTSQYDRPPPQTSSQTPPQRNRPNPQTDSGESIATYITPDQVKASREFKRQQNEQRSSTGGGLNTLARTALNFLVPGSSLLMNQGIGQGIGNALGNFRQKFTGYRTQAEYDAARQQRRNLDRIRTIQNTLNRKYADGDYSNTNLDERLAGLQALMGIVPNTAEQDAQQFLDFGNELAETTEATPSTLDLSKLETSDLNNIASLINNAEQSQAIAPDFMRDSPQFLEGIDNSMYGGDRMLFGSNSPNELYYDGDVLPGGMVIESDADGITNYDFDEQPQGIMGLDGVPTDEEIAAIRFP